MDDLTLAAHGITVWFGKLRLAGFDTDNQRLKVLKEAQEFADTPTLEEAADVFITIVGACQVHGWSMRELAGAVDAKMKINRQRTWEQLPDGTYQHK